MALIETLETGSFRGVTIPEIYLERGLGYVVFFSTDEISTYLSSKSEFQSVQVNTVVEGSLKVPLYFRKKEVRSAKKSNTLLRDIDLDWPDFDNLYSFFDKLIALVLAEVESSDLILIGLSGLGHENIWKLFSFILKLSKMRPSKIFLCLRPDSMRDRMEGFEIRKIIDIQSVSEVYS